MVHCGHVYCLPWAVAGKEKLLVPAFIDATGRVRYFVINTEISDFLKKRPEVLTHVLPLPLNGHELFLKHDSWLHCNEVVGGLNAQELEGVADKRYRAPLMTPVAVAVRALIQTSRLHSERDKAAILEQWPNPSPPAC